jgi:hypothetical protein
MDLPQQPIRMLLQLLMPQNKHHHGTFAELYGNELEDPCAGQYARIMAHFDPIYVNAVQGNILIDQAFRAYLCCSSS